MPNALSPWVACLLGAAFLLAAGCASSEGASSEAPFAEEISERPQSLDPVAVGAPARSVYDEALTLAFDEGYDIIYADNQNLLLELESLALASDVDDVRQLDLLVRRERGQTRVRARARSFDPDAPGDIEATETDREAARRFLDQLLRRLGER